MRLRTLAFALATPFLVGPSLVAQEQEKPQQQKQKGGFDAQQWNSAVGLGGGAGGRYGVRSMSRRNPNKPAVDMALSWLASQQSPDGSWDSGHSKDATVAVTGTAMLAMLGNGSTMRSGPHKRSIKLAVNWLRRNQQESGAFAEATGPHLIAAYAMAEAYVLSSYKLIKKCSVNALKFAETRRAEDGGWRASEEAKGSDPALTMWGTQLLGTWEFEGTLKDFDKDKRILKWLCSAQANVAPENGVLGSKAPVARIGELAFDQSAANAWTLYWLPKNKDDVLQKRAAIVRDMALARARELPRKWQKDPKHKLSITEWYSSSHAFSQAKDPASLRKMTKALVAAQVKDGENKGSWDPIGVWGDVGGRTWTTAMATMTLCASFRYSNIGRK